VSYLSKKEYHRIASKFPILCVDAIITHKGRYLLVKRKNEPLKGQWWVVGGRVYKGETLEKAMLRKVKEETGLDVRIITKQGTYEEVYEVSDIGVSKHTVSVAFIVEPLEDPVVKLDSQSSEYKWSSYLPKKFKQQVFKQNVH